MLVTSKKMTAAILAITLAMSLSACSNWSKRDRNTAIGAGAGAIGGAVLTDGSTLGTLGGAAVGGIIGHQVGKYSTVHRLDIIIRLLFQVCIIKKPRKNSVAFFINRQPI